ncbi:MAG: LuxR C-terminal-related transcriptional regulator [Gordonia sp. (in: high G+C Gram-positive bacteria)]
MNADEWSEIRRCHAEGESIKGIAERLGMSRNTVRRALALTVPPDDHRRRSGSVTDDVDARIRDLLADSPEMTIAEVGRRLQWERSRTLLARRVRAIRAEVDAAQPVAGLSGVLLPQQPTSFVGRREELRTLRALLGDHRLITVAGPGGMGKTRLASQAAWEFRRAFPDGVRFIGFAAVRGDHILAQTVCDALGLDNRDAVGQSAEDALLGYLRTKRMLLVLDNCEHVIDGAAELISRMLESTEAIRILATSREYLSLPSEYVFQLQSLPTDASGAGAIELFVRRADAVLSGFAVDDENLADVRRICERLDGVPLAIELACTRLAVLSVHDLARLLDSRVLSLSKGSRDRVSRHRSLQATIDWSHELCSGVERDLWARLSIFADGFDLDTARAVCADTAENGPGIAAEEITDAMAALVAKSVVLRETVDGRVRFRMLESIREYGAATLTATQRHCMGIRLLDWALGVIAESAREWFGPRQLQCADAVRRNRGNIRAAIHLALSDVTLRSRVGDVAAVLGAAPCLWACGIAIREHRMWMTQILDLPDVEPAAVGRLLGVLGLVQTLQGDRDSAEFALRRAAEIADLHGDRPTAVFATHISGLKAFFAGDFGRAAVLLASASEGYAELGAGSEMTAMLGIHQGMLSASILDVEAATAAFRRVYDESEEAGDTWFRSYATYGLGLSAWLGGDHESAARLAREALRGHRPFDDMVGTTLMTDLLGWSLAALGPAEAETAAVLLGAASTIWGSFGRQLYGSDHWNSLRCTALDAAHAQLSTSAFAAAWERGRAMSSAELLEYVFGDTDRPAPGRPPNPAVMGTLSPREREVADMVAAGMTNREIAERLVLSVRTVEGHVEHVLRKMCLERRAEVVGALRAVPAR